MQKLDVAVLQAEYNIILKTLIQVNFNKKKAAEILGIDRKTLYNKLKKINETPIVRDSVQTVMS